MDQKHSITSSRKGKTSHFRGFVLVFHVSIVTSLANRNLAAFCNTFSYLLLE